MTAHTTLPIGPFSGARVALLVVNLLGDEKGRYYSDSVTAALDKARDCASYPDTVVYVFDTDNSGEMRGTANARIQRDGVGPVRFHTM
jgi:hypothetical protein